jgi:hypothetical protein
VYTGAAGTAYALACLCRDRRLDPSGKYAGAVRRLTAHLCAAAPAMRHVREHGVSLFCGHAGVYVAIAITSTTLGDAAAAAQ